jgi:hypothetical protein
LLGTGETSLGRAAVTDFVERFVLKHTFTSDDVDFVSMQRGWILVKAQLQEGEAYVDGWVTLDRQTEIHQVDDRPIGTRYLTVRGPGSADLAHHIRQACDLWTTPEVLASLSRASTRDATLTAVYAAVLSATEQDAPEVVREFRPLAAHPDPGIRQSLIIAAGYFPTPDLLALVQPFRHTDPVAHIRTNATLLLEALPTPDRSERLGRNENGPDRKRSRPFLRS